MRPCDKSDSSQCHKIKKWEGEKRFRAESLLINKNYWCPGNFILIAYSPWINGLFERTVIDWAWNAACKANNHIVQGSALGTRIMGKLALKGQKPEKQMLLPFQGDCCALRLPRALPWAMCLMPFQGVFLADTYNNDQTTYLRQIECSAKVRYFNNFGGTL